MALLIPAFLLLISPLAMVAGCGQAGAVVNYTTMANGILSSVNAKDGELKKYWMEPVTQQTALSTTLTEFRKTLSDAQEKLDAIDSPAAARKLDDLLGLIVDNSRALADISTQFADYLGSLAPLTKQASDIVAQIQGLDKVQDVPSAVGGMLAKAQQLDGQTRSVSPPAPFVASQAEFQNFVSLLVGNLEGAQKKLSNLSYDSPSNNSRNTEPAASDTQQGDQEHSQAVQAISEYTDPIIEEWGRLNGAVSAQLEQVREATGLKDKTSVVENYIGQAVAEIQNLEKQYK